MPKLWDKTGDAKDNSDLVAVDSAKLNITSPTVVYLPGRDQCDGDPTELSKGIHFVNKIFADLPTPPRTYIWSHSDMYSKGPLKNVSSIFHMAAFSHLWHYAGPAAKSFAKDIIMPLVTDAEGKSLPCEQAKKNLRNLTLLGYCLGSLTAQEAYNASLKMMQKTGYSKEDTRELLREVVLVSFATFTRPEREKNRYTTINFVNSDDLFVGIKNMVARPLSTFIKFGKVLLPGSHKLDIQSLSETSLLISAAAREQPLPSILKKGKEHEVIDDVTLPRWKIKATNHLARDYVNDNEQTSQFAGMVKYALLNAVTRKGTVRPVDLLNEPAIEKDTPEEKERYEKKIDDGLLRAAGKPKWKKIMHW